MVRRVAPRCSGPRLRQRRSLAGHAVELSRAWRVRCGVCGRPANSVAWVAVAAHDLSGSGVLEYRLSRVRHRMADLGIVALLLAFITWQGLQLFLKDGASIGQVLSPTWQPDATSGAANFGLLPVIGGTVFVTGVALLISPPLSVGLALFLPEVAPAGSRPTPPSRGPVRPWPRLRSSTTPPATAPTPARPTARAPRSPPAWSSSPASRSAS